MVSQSVSDDPVRVERVDGAHVVRLDRETNVFDEAFVASFHAALDAIETDAAALAVVTTGSGKYFSNGFDLEFLASLEGDALWDFVVRACRLVARVLTFPAPTVAAINGHAFGIGAILALAHDQRVMRIDRGWFCLPEVDLGLSFHPFMQALITARLPAATAQEAILTGRRYDGASAVERGIVDATATEDALVTCAVERIAPWSGKRPDVLGALKHQLHSATLATLEH
jgi:Delta3-Delta2-enoyl-CoA isomerase